MGCEVISLRAALLLYGGSLMKQSALPESGLTPRGYVTEKQMELQMFASLTAGSTGLLYWMIGDGGAGRGRCCQSDAPHHILCG